MSDLIERLRFVDGEKDGTRWYRNPDGPHAAAMIESLEARLELTRNMHDRANQRAETYAEALRALVHEVCVESSCHQSLTNTGPLEQAQELLDWEWPENGTDE